MVNLKFWELKYRCSFFETCLLVHAAHSDHTKWFCIVVITQAL